MVKNGVYLERVLSALANRPMPPKEVAENAVKATQTSDTNQTAK